MKGFVGGILATVIGGILVFLAQNWWSDSQNREKQRIIFEKNSELSLNKDDLRRLADKANSYQDAAIQVFTASNIGTNDISDKSFSTANKYVWAYGSISEPNSNPKNVNISYDGKVLSIKYRLLPTKSKHIFWIASPAPNLSSEFSNDTTGVHVVTELEKLGEEYSFPWGWLGLGAALLIALIVGAGIGNAVTVIELEKAGHNYKSLIAKSTDQPSTP